MEVCPARADIFLYWLLFEKIIPNINDIEAIRFFKRFIDDCIGLWRGTRRSFDSFVTQLNKEAAKYGIKFPLDAVQFGKSVDMLDITPYLEEDNTIQYKGFSKPTDAKRYLNTKSFHPRSVFQSIPFSQMIRIMENNSKEDTRNEQVEELINHFENSGYNPRELQKLKQKAINKTSTVTAPTTNTDNNNDENNDSNNNTLVFPIYYFEGIHEFKSMVRDLQADIQQLIGDTRVMFAIKKGSSVGNMLVRNKALCDTISTNNSNQKCNAPGCQQCPLVNAEKKMVINNNPHVPEL